MKSCTSSVIHAPLEYTWEARDFSHTGSGHNVMLCIRGQTVRDFVSPMARNPAAEGAMSLLCPECTSRVSRRQIGKDVFSIDCRRRRCVRPCCESFAPF